MPTVKTVIRYDARRGEQGSICLVRIIRSFVDGTSDALFATLALTFTGAFSVGSELILFSAHANQTSLAMKTKKIFNRIMLHIFIRVFDNR